MKKIRNSVLIVFLGIPLIAAGQSSLTYLELNLIGGYSRIYGWRSKTIALKNSIGLEYYRKFSGDYGDYLTLDLQARLTYDFDQKFKKAFALEIHNALLEYKIAYGYNIRAGHFDIPFCLEPNVDTHGTVLQTFAQKNIGFKQDWGIAFRGALEYFDYALALTLGQGMGITIKSGSYLVSGRVGSPSERNFQVGLSFIYGKVFESMDMSTFPAPDYGMIISKKRVGVDAQYLVGPFLLKGEIAYGKNDQNKMFGALLESDYTLPFFQSLELELQSLYWQDDLSNRDSRDLTVSAGISYKVNSSITLRTTYFHDIYAMGRQPDKQIFVQLYVYKRG